jgi:hypothetical protein
MVLAQKIFRLDSGQTKHFRNLVKGQGLIAVAFQSGGFQGTAGNIAARGGQPPSHIVGNVQDEIHTLQFSTINYLPHSR